jgi:hypothetical protein
MRDVVAQDLALDLVQRRTDGADLGQHVHAVAVILDHALDAAHLSLDLAQPRQERRVVATVPAFGRRAAVLHAPHLPYPGSV